jgi:hypothetical protein
LNQRGASCTPGASPNFVELCHGEVPRKLAEFGDILAVPIDETGPTCTGHYAESTTFHSNELGGTFTQVLGGGVSRGSDGSLINFHGLTRYSVNANGELTVDFLKVIPDESCLTGGQATVCVLLRRGV